MQSSVQQQWIRQEAGGGQWSGQEGNQMDSRRFDALTRSLATGTSRRTLLKGLFGGAALGGAAVTSVRQVEASHCTAPGTFHCEKEGMDPVCCPNALNCCGGVCCPSSQCHEALDICCLEGEFACDAGSGDNACCSTGGEKCCDGVCIDVSTCCPALGDCTSTGSICCAAGQFCSQCCDNDDCPGACSVCNQGGCVDDDALCPDCQVCTNGTCGIPEILCEVILAPCCIEGIWGCHECCDADDCDPPDACTPAACNAGACETGSFCGDPSVCCPDGECRECCEECCSNADCETNNTCEICLNGACIRACPEDEECCITGPDNDVTIECVSECCNDDDCDDCFSCYQGICDPDVILCEQGTSACCVEGRLTCTECCGLTGCDECEVCFNGTCVTDEECCPRFGETCGYILRAAGESEQLDCCEGLLCCDGDPPICAECCGDRDCPKDECCCQDGTCSHHCCDRICKHDKHCPYGECCCRDGSCSSHCCDKGCRYDKDCPYGTCCCHDGNCSAKCCDTPGTMPPVDTLPDTGSGDSQEGGLGAVGAAAALGAAAYLAGKTFRQDKPAEAPTDDWPGTA